MYTTRDQFYCAQGLLHKAAGLDQSARGTIAEALRKQPLAAHGVFLHDPKPTRLPAFWSISGACVAAEGVLLLTVGPVGYSAESAAMTLLHLASSNVETRELQGHYVGGLHATKTAAYLSPASDTPDGPRVGDLLSDDLEAIRQAVGEFVRLSAKA